MQETQHPVWTFDLFVYGAFQIQGRWNLEDPEDFSPEEVFFRALEFKSSPHGAQVILKVEAAAGHFAHHVALFHLGQVVDVLAMRCNLPMFVSRTEPRPFARSQGNLKRVIEQSEWQSAFHEASQLNQREPAFLRALGAYRNALCAESAHQRFASFWNAISLVAASIDVSDKTSSPATHPELLRIQQCFRQLWGEPSQWPPFCTLEDLNNLLATHTQFFHDAASIHPQHVVQLVEQLERIHRLSHAFLTDWRNQKVTVPGLFYHTSIKLETGWGDVLQ